MSTNLAFSFVHEQVNAADQWTIVHGTGQKPSVFVQVQYGNGLQAMIPKDISYPDLNTVVVSFSAPFAGTARLI